MAHESRLKNRVESAHRLALDNEHLRRTIDDLRVELEEAHSRAAAFPPASVLVHAIPVDAKTMRTRTVKTQTHSSLAAVMQPALPTSIAKSFDSSALVVAEAVSRSQLILLECDARSKGLFRWSEELALLAATSIVARQRTKQRAKAEAERRAFRAVLDINAAEFERRASIVQSRLAQLMALGADRDEVARCALAIESRSMATSRHALAQREAAVARRESELEAAIADVAAVRAIRRADERLQCSPEPTCPPIATQEQPQSSEPGRRQQSLDVAVSGMERLQHLLAQAAARASRPSTEARFNYSAASSVANLSATSQTEERGVGSLFGDSPARARSTTVGATVTVLRSPLRLVPDKLGVQDRRRLDS